MSRFIPVIILSLVFISGCVGAGEFGTQFGILPKSSLPIIGGGRESIGKRVVHIKGGDEVTGYVWYDTRTDIYYVFKAENDAIGRQWQEAHTIPKDQVSYMEHYDGELPKW